MSVEKEHELARRLAAQDSSAGRLFLEGYARRIFHLHFRLTRDDDLSHDLTQDTILRVIEKAADYRGEGPFAAWVLRIAGNLARETLRNRKRRERLMTEAVSDGRIVASGLTRSDPELHSTLWNLISALSENEQLVLKLALVDGYSHDEIAASLDIAPGTSRSILSGARAKLRRLIEPENLLPWKTNNSTSS